MFRLRVSSFVCGAALVALQISAAILATPRDVPDASADEGVLLSLYRRPPPPAPKPLARVQPHKMINRRPSDSTQPPAQTPTGPRPSLSDPGGLAQPAPDTSRLVRRAAPPEPPSPPQIDDKAEIAAYQSLLWRAISLHRPVSPRAVGYVTLTFEVDDSGNAEALRVADSSGDPMLERLAREAVQRSLPLPKRPSSLTADTRFLLKFSFGSTSR
jgi:protein TonB